MRNLILILACVFSLNCFAHDHSYNVSGEDENGKLMEGNIYFRNGDRNVYGELTDENGDSHEFSGRWDGYRKITGETDEGVEVELETNHF